jgi:antirestriction protein ArdC
MTMPTPLPERVPYRGINVLTLWVAAMSKGYSSPHWLTFKQAIALGGCVRSRARCVRFSRRSGRFAPARGWRRARAFRQFIQPYRRGSGMILRTQLAPTHL